jgi:PAS domain S-box-containing protein
VSVAVAGLLPLVPSTLIIGVPDLGEATSALLLLTAVLLACLVGGVVGGVAATTLAAFVFDLMVLPPRFTLVLSGPALLHLFVFTATAATIVAVIGQLIQADSARVQAEDRSNALTEQVRLIAPVLDGSPIGVAVFDTALRYTYLNPALARLNRRGVEEHLGLSMSELFGAEQSRLAEPPLRDVLTTGEPQYNVDLTAEVDGAVRHYLVNRYPVHTAHSDLLGVAVTVQDITERQHLAALQAEAARLRTTAELAHRLEAAQRIAGFGSWELDVATGRVDWSTQMRAILGLDASPEQLPEVWQFVHPDDLHKAGAFTAALSGGGAATAVELRMVRADGQAITVVASGEPVHDPNGQPVKLWGTIVDVTVQRRAEAVAREAIRAAEATRAQLAVEHAILQRFQRAMLPASVPTISGVDLAVAYRAHAERAEIGGDWYDAFTLPDGRLVLAIGDVTGHDLQAATIMGQVRNAVRAYALLDPAPGLVLQRTNALLRALPELHPTTMIFGVYHPRTCTLTWSRAGHPPPLHRHNGTVTVLDPPNGPLLGAVANVGRYAEATIDLVPGDTLLWYTDGLIERRGGDILAAEEQLCDLLASPAAAAGADEVVSLIDHTLIADHHLDDDACLLVVHLPRAAVLTTPSAGSEIHHAAA